MIGNFDWVIMGALNPKNEHKMTNYAEVINKCSYYKKPLFIKSNFKNIGDSYKKHQQYPEAMLKHLGRI